MVHYGGISNELELQRKKSKLRTDNRVLLNFVRNMGRLFLIIRQPEMLHTSKC